MHNFKHYRKELHKRILSGVTVLPYIRMLFKQLLMIQLTFHCSSHFFFIALLLRDLLFLKDGNSQVSAELMKMVKDQIATIQKLQTLHYNFAIDPLTHAFCQNMQTVPDEDKLFSLALKQRPESMSKFPEGKADSATSTPVSTSIPITLTHSNNPLTLLGKSDTLSITTDNGDEEDSDELLRVPINRLTTTLTTDALMMSMDEQSSRREEDDETSSYNSEDSDLGRIGDLEKVFAAKASLT